MRASPQRRRPKAYAAFALLLACLVVGEAEPVERAVVAPGAAAQVEPDPAPVPGGAQAGSRGLGLRRREDERPASWRPLGASPLPIAPPRSPCGGSAPRPLPPAVRGPLRC